MSEIIEKDLSYKIVGVAYKIRDELGFGFLEKVYENALVVGLRKIGLRVGFDGHTFSWSGRWYILCGPCR